MDISERQEMATATTTNTLNVAPQEVVAEPFPHIVNDNIIEPALYRRLKAEYPPDEFFDRTSTVGGRAGRDLYRGDAAYSELLKTSPAWREFYEYLNSRAYLDLALALFGNHLRQFACQVEHHKARLVDHIEPREALETKSRIRGAVADVAHLLARSKGKDELFVRLDLAQGAVGYSKPVHCDRRNRLTSMIVYFCDPQEAGMQGGELLLHEHLVKKPYGSYERHPKPEMTRAILRIAPMNNRGVFFLCSNNSYHSATAVTLQSSYRNFIYVSISSKALSIW